LSYDIQFLSLADDIQVVTATEIANANPRAIRLVCKGDVRSAKTVRINGISVPDFSVVSDHALLVTPGALFASASLADLDFVVISSRWTSGNRVRLLFTPTVNLSRVSGVQKLIQQLVKSLLAHAGSNRFDRSEGGSVLRALGLSLDPNSKAQIASVFAEAASRTEAQYVAAQAGKKLPASERLLSFQLSQVAFDSDKQQAVAVLRVTTYAGNDTALPLIL
jgi:hypothetical protein